MINVIYEDNHLLVVEKKQNIPVQKDISNDLDLLTQLKQYLKEKYNKPGNVYLGLVHRLDRTVGGIMVFAKTSKAASRLSNQIREKKFNKKYYAVVHNKMEKQKAKYVDKLLKDKKNNIVKISELGKEAILEYELIDYKDNLSLVNINLLTGRPHQIRVQFSSRNHPLYGDHKYNPNNSKDKQIALYSYYLSFEHPTTKKIMEFKLELPNKYPWNIFKK